MYYHSVHHLIYNYLYDIPARYSESEVISAIKNLGNVHRIRIKKHYKYQSVRAEISLFDENEDDFVKETWKVQLLIGRSEKTQNTMQVRWFPGQSTVKSIKEKCKWKAYKIIRSSYYQDVARKNYSFEYGKMARFGKNLVFLAYFKNKEQLDAARALDKGADDTWIIHGKGLGNLSEEVSKRDSCYDLVSTTPKDNGKGKFAIKEKQAESGRCGFGLRAEINKELSQDEKEDASWIEKCRNGYAALVTELKEGKKKIDKERAKRDALQKKWMRDRYFWMKLKLKKSQKWKPTKTHTKEELAEWAKFYKNQYQEIIKDAQRKRSLAKQGDRVKEEEGIDSDSDEDKEGEVVVSTESSNKRGGKPGSRGKGRGGRRRLV
uniref:Uncharacterized protein n=1 Tax=Rhizophagus irregularis (strain DAOM 181602 / DAOM 197198 / MUCL 43194) TaxID=747089 RepID=U9SNP9_RHIID